MLVVVEVGLEPEHRCSAGTKEVAERCANTASAVLRVTLEWNAKQ